MFAIYCFYTPKKTVFMGPRYPYRDQTSIHKDFQYGPLRPVKYQHGVARKAHPFISHTYGGVQRVKLDFPNKLFRARLQ